jgi:DNA-binding MarR family transcriptional regulator
MYGLAPEAMELVKREAARLLCPAAPRDVAPADDPLRVLAEQRARTWPQLDSLALLISFRVERLVAAMHQDLQEIAAEAGLSRGEVLALGAIAAGGPPYETSPTELKGALWISLPGIGKRLDLLESRGLIQRLPDPDDRRAQRIRLTERGLTALVATRFGSHIPSHVALAQMPADQKLELERLLRMWLEAIGRDRGA